MVNNKKISASKVNEILENITIILNDNLPKRKARKSNSTAQKEKKVEDVENQIENIENHNENENNQNV